jgi:type IV pilus assembly protein PilE
MKGGQTHPASVSTGPRCGEPFASRPFAGPHRIHRIRSGARRARLRGFTAIELLITVATIAILVTVALPAYNSTIVRANRAAAQSFLLDLANREEQYLLDARTYTTTVGDLLAPPETVTPYYSVTITVPSGSSVANAYVITATPVATSIQKNDGNLSINQDGVRTGSW